MLTKNKRNKMKTNTLIFNLLLCTFFSFSGIKNSISKEEALTKAVIKTAIYCDHCQVCESCGGKFEVEMAKIQGLKKYTLVDSKNYIIVYYDNKKTNITTIRNAISKMGFDADMVKANKKAYLQLDACCKKRD
jgi:mercuric ion binding protein